MSDDKTDGKFGGMKLTSKDAIYGIVLVVGFVFILSGLNGALGWSVADWLITAIGATLGVAAAFALSWLRSR